METLETLTVIGGASAYAPGLVAALIHHHRDLALRQVRLHDIDQDRLDIVGRLCARMARSKQASFDVAACPDLDEALAGADVVLNSARPGGLACRHLDETLPLEFDIPGQETVGPGGFFFALRSVPQALGLAARMERLCPRAMLLNYTNPTNIVTQALRDRSSLRVVGLCDQSDEDLDSLARALGAEAITAYHCFGLNHATWYTGLEIGDEPLTMPPGHLEPPAGLDAEHALRFSLSCELAEGEPGFWPNSYLPYYTHPGRFVALSREDGPRSDVIMAKLPSYYAHFAEEGAREHPELRHHRGAHGFGDLAVRVLRALGAGEPTTLVLNTPNSERHPATDAGTVVEHRVSLSRRGARAGETPAVPSSFAELLSRLESYQRQTAAAAADGDRTAAIEALAANPLVRTRELAARMIERAREAYDDAIPVLA